MLHDNDSGEEHPAVPKIFPSELAKRKYPEVDGLYVTKCEGDVVVGLVYYYHNEWLSYPNKFSLDTVTINSKIEYCVGPI